MRLYIFIILQEGTGSGCTARRFPASLLAYVCRDRRVTQTRLERDEFQGNERKFVENFSSDC